MSPPRNRIMPSITFKIVYTDNVWTYNVDPNWKLDDFWNIMKSRIIRDIRIENYELVEAGQNTDISENGIAFNKDENIRLCEKYGPNVNVSFYIRPIDIHIVETRRTTITDRLETECVLCYQNIHSRQNYGYGCNHPICQSCFRECRQHSIQSCPICRQRIL